MITKEELGSMAEANWCMALHGNHDEHQCHKKPGHDKHQQLGNYSRHECVCGVVW